MHEWAHAYVAYKLGDPTARNLGRMTLNPIAHFDLFGFISLALIGFGWAKPVPINPSNFKHFKRDDILVSLAGITANLIMAMLFMLLYLALVSFTGLVQNEVFHGIMQSIIIINLSLMVFNLIPIYPLDGSHIAESLLMRRIPKVMMWLRRYGYWILLAFLFTGLLSGVLSKVVLWIYNLLFMGAAAIIRLFLIQ